MGMVVQNQTLGHVQYSARSKQGLYGIDDQNMWKQSHVQNRVQNLSMAIWSTRSNGGHVEFKVEGGRVE